MNKISIKESVLMACIIEAIQASLFDDGVSPEQEELYNNMIYSIMLFIK